MFVSLLVSDASILPEIRTRTGVITHHSYVSLSVRRQESLLDCVERAKALRTTLVTQFFFPPVEGEKLQVRGVRRLKYIHRTAIGQCAMNDAMNVLG